MGGEGTGVFEDERVNELASSVLNRIDIPMKRKKQKSVIDDVFRPIYGKPCWNVEQGYGSFLTLEFGEPQLRVQEPRKASKQAPESLKRRWARRFVYVRGKWHLWFYICNWKIIILGEEKANYRSSKRAIQKAAIEINGEKLVRVTVDKSLVTTFDFDLGGKLICTPSRSFDKDSDLWLFYEPSGKVFTLRANGKYSHIPGNTPSDKEKWMDLF